MLSIIYYTDLANYVIKYAKNKYKTPNEIKLPQSPTFRHEISIPLSVKVV
jgi:hypothetical protein